MGTVRTLRSQLTRTRMGRARTGVQMFFDPDPPNGGATGTKDVTPPAPSTVAEPAPAQDTAELQAALAKAASNNKRLEEALPKRNDAEQKAKLKAEHV